jgi:Spy/CpxP family protein refolding chaperone
MHRFRLLTAAAVVAGLLAGGAVYAQQQGPRFGGPGRGFGPGGPGLPLAALNLNEGQQQQIKDIRERHRDEVRAAEEALRTAMDAQRKAIETIPVDEGLIQSTAQQLANAQTAAAIIQAHIYSESWNVLSTEQQDTLKKLQAERGTRGARPGRRG